MNINRLVGILATLFIIINLVLGNFAFACSCKGRESAEIELFKKDFVFIGKVIRVTGKDYVYSTKFKVLKQYKGNLGEFAIVRGAGFNCDYTFQKNKEYLVYAFGSNSDELRTSKCDGTNELSSAKRDVEVFDKLCCHSDQAISDYSKAIENNPKSAWLYEYRAIAYFLIKDYNNSWIDVDKAVELGVKLEPRFLKDLKKASGREK